MIGEHGPEAVIPLPGTRVFIAPAGTPPPSFEATQREVRDRMHDWMVEEYDRQILGDPDAEPQELTGLFDGTEWAEVGSGIELDAVSLVHESPWPTVPALTTTSASVSFEARLNAEQVRLLYGIPLSLIGPRGRHRVRSVTRRKYRARARRRT